MSEMPPGGNALLLTLTPTKMPFVRQCWRRSARRRGVRATAAVQEPPPGCGRAVVPLADGDIEPVVHQDALVRHFVVDPSPPELLDRVEIRRRVRACRHVVQILELLTIQSRYPPHVV